MAASVGISYSVSVAQRAPDEDHPFGHARAEPLAALGVAIFTAILGFSVAREAFERILAGPGSIRGAHWALLALIGSMLGNLALARFLRRRGEALDSPAILANAVECENDIGASFAALVGVLGATLGWPVIDPVAGIVVGAWIIVGGYRFGRRNIDYLMGKSPSVELLAYVRRQCLGLSSVQGVHDVRGHYVGHRIHVEVHIEVDQELTTKQSHDVGGEARHAIERHPMIDRAFVHVDPILDSTLIVETLAANERLVSRIYTRLSEQVPGRPELAALWRALAARSQARAERLGVTTRLKSAGWHFRDEDLSPDRLRDRRQRLRAVSVAVEEDGWIDELESLIGELEDLDAARDYIIATTPGDATMRSSIAAAAPPEPRLDRLLQRCEAARGAEDDDRIRGYLTALGRRLEVVARPD